LKPKKGAFWSLRAWVRGLVPLVAVAAGLALFLRPTGEGPQDNVRTKGSPEVFLYVKSPGKPPHKLEAAEALHPGDAVQLGYRSAGRKHLTAFVVQDGCKVTESFSGAAQAVGVVPESWQLDTKESKERLYLAFSERRVDLQAFQAALEEAAGCNGPAVPQVNSPDFVARGLSVPPRVP
jgi:hypothetical protein